MTVSIPSERVAKLEEASDASKIDRKELWKHVGELGELKTDSKVILSKLDDLKVGQAKLNQKFDEDKVSLAMANQTRDKEIQALKTRADRADGALAVIVAVAGSIGGGIGFALQWAVGYVWPKH